MMLSRCNFCNAETPTKDTEERKKVYRVYIVSLDRDPFYSASCLFDHDIHLCQNCARALASCVHVVLKEDEKKVEEPKKAEPPKKKKTLFECLMTGGH
jgi:hypothetical protein